MGIYDRLFTRSDSEPQLPMSLKPKKAPFPLAPELAKVNDKKSDSQLEFEQKKVLERAGGAIRRGLEDPRSPQIKKFTVIHPAIYDPNSPDPMSTIDVIGFGGDRIVPMDCVGFVSCGFLEVPPDDDDRADQYNQDESFGQYDIILVVAFNPISWSYGCPDAQKTTEFRAFNVTEKWHKSEPLYNVGMVSARLLADYRMALLDEIKQARNENREPAPVYQHFVPLRYRFGLPIPPADKSAEAEAATVLFVGDNGKFHKMRNVVYLPEDKTLCHFVGGYLVDEELNEPPFDVAISIPGIGKDRLSDGSWNTIPGSGSWGIFPGNIMDFQADVGPMKLRVNYAEFCARSDADRMQPTLEPEAAQDVPQST